jgi:hypothetical protein
MIRRKPVPGLDPGMVTASPHEVMRRKRMQNVIGSI